MDYICMGVLTTYYTVCCGLICCDLCREYYYNNNRAREYTNISHIDRNISMMTLREYETRQHMRLDSIPEE